MQVSFRSKCCNFPLAYATKYKMQAELTSIPTKTANNFTEYLYMRGRICRKHLTLGLYKLLVLNRQVLQ